ncbi:MAG: hypothetical protein ACC700_16515 [Anaerolineales bacterium]
MDPDFRAILDNGIHRAYPATSLARGIEILGHSVLVETNSEEFAAITERLLRSFDVSVDYSRQPEVVFGACISDDPKVPHQFLRDGKLFRETNQFWKLVRLLEWQLDIFLWHHEEQHMLMHAGSIAVGDAGVLIPGSSRAGKSSLTMSLLLRGGRYFSDEVGVVTTDTSELLPFPKPLSSRVPDMFPEVTSWFGPSQEEVAEEVDGWTPVWFAHADDIRSDSISEPARVTHIIFPEPGDRSNPVLEPMTESEAMKRILRHTVNFKILGSSAFHALAGIVRAARAYRLIRNGIDSTAELVLETVTADIT